MPLRKANQTRPPRSSREPAPTPGSPPAAASPAGLHPLPIVVAAGVVILSALAMARWDGRSPANAARSGASAQPPGGWEAHARALSARLDRIPQTLADWEGQDLELDQAQATAAELAGWWMRRYERWPDGVAVTVVFLWGPPGPLAHHEPTACYPAAGYEKPASRARSMVRAGPTSRPAEFQIATFRKRWAVVPDELRVLWTWQAGGAWVAPDAPRAAFATAGGPVLYKLYAIRNVTTDNEPLEDDPALELLRELLPELEAALGPDPQSGAR